MRRWIRISALALVAGAIVNVLVAWTLALTMDGLPYVPWIQRVEGASAPPPARWDSVQIVPRAGSTVIIFSATTAAPVLPRPLSANATDEDIREFVVAGEAFQRGDRFPPSPFLPVVEVPHWSRAATPPRHDEYDRYRYLEDARGWPFRSLISHFDRPRPGVIAPARPTWRLDMLGKQGPLGLPRGLPLRPLPIGFALNTLIYGILCLPLLLALQTWRRRRACRRGRCPACDYPVGVSPVCTECGASLPAR